MKILRQDWNIVSGGQITSISIDRDQLNETIKELAPEEDPNNEDEVLNFEKAARPDGGAEEINIPDDSIFADMVKEGTVFLHNDEMDIIWNACSEEQ